MGLERRRAPRYHLVADMIIRELHSDARVTAKTSDFSLVGCFLNSRRSFAEGTKVEIEVQREETVFRARATVARVHPMGMGLNFSALKPDQQQILTKWLMEARGAAQAV